MSHKNDETAPVMLSLAEVARRTGRNATALGVKCQKGQIPGAVMIYGIQGHGGKSWRVPETSVAAIPPKDPTNGDSTGVSSQWRKCLLTREQMIELRNILTVEQIAERAGVSKQRVSQIITGYKPPTPRSHKETRQRENYGRKDADLERGMKHCAGCGQELPIGEFWRDKTRPDGYCDRCKPCDRGRKGDYFKTRYYPRHRITIKKRVSVARRKRVRRQRSEAFVSATQAAGMIGYSIRTITIWCAAGKLSGAKRGETLFGKQSWSIPREVVAALPPAPEARQGVRRKNTTS